MKAIILGFKLGFGAAFGMATARTIVDFAYKKIVEKNSEVKEPEEE